MGRQDSGKIQQFKKKSEMKIKLQEHKKEQTTTNALRKMERYFSKAKRNDKGVETM